MARILLISHEDDCFSILDTAQHLKNNNHEVLVIEGSISYATDLSNKYFECKKSCVLNYGHQLGPSIKDYETEAS